MSPLVSVIVPLYNHRNYVERCLDSIARETYDNIELLILDDGSTDESFEIARRWGDANTSRFVRFELLRQPNAGISKTLNRLVKMARGEFIAPLASDDMMLPDGIEERVSYLEANPHLLAVFGDCLVIDDQDNIICDSGVCGFHAGSARRSALLDPELIGIELAMRWSIPGPVFMMRSQAPDLIGPYDESLIVEDRDYYLRLAARGRIGFVDHKVACYRWHGQNTAHDATNNEKRLWSLAQASKNASVHARGLLKAVLLTDHCRRTAWHWREETGLKRVQNSLIYFASKAVRKLAERMHESRYRRRTRGGKNHEERSKE